LDPALLAAEAVKIITAEVTTIVARGEPPDRLLDDHAKAALMVHHPWIWPFLPNDAETIYNNYVVKIDEDSTKELEDFIKRRPGLINVSFDGATVNGKQKVSKCTDSCASTI